MLRPRIIPCLLIRNGALTKTVKFAGGKYVGDPLNAVRIFNEKEADELIVLDIDATVQRRQPDFKFIAQIARECRMPLCYGGGVSSVEDFKKLISLGVEKVAISNAIFSIPGLVEAAAKSVGSQSVAGVLDVRKRPIKLGYEVYVKNGSEGKGRCPADLAKELQNRGVGEILINSYDRDGTMAGYDLDLLRKIRSVSSIPLIGLGGAGSLDDIADLFRTTEQVAAAAGSLFVYKGPFKAVLINYPSAAERDKLFSRAGLGD